MRWWAWWAAGLLVPFVQWPSCTVWASARLSWALWAASAGCLACAEARQRREVRLLPLAATVGLVLLQHLSVSLPTVLWNEWTRAWEVVAALSSLGCFAIALAFGTQAVIRHAPSITSQGLEVLVWVLWANLPAWLLQRLGLWSLWRFADNAGGIFPNQLVWAGWCAILAPIAWMGCRREGRWGRMVPILAGLVISYPLMPWVALVVGWVLPTWVRWGKTGVATSSMGALALALGAVVLKGGHLVLTKIVMRLQTWWAVLEAIWRHPWGIGSSAFAYANALSVNRPALLPHPASDVLAGLLVLGWFILPVLSWAFWKAWQPLTHPAQESLRVALCLAMLSTSVSLPHIGVLCWVLLCWWAIDAHEPQEVRMG